MKKCLLSLGLIISAIAANGQTLINGNFEDAMTAIPSFAYTNQTNGWLYLINGGPETVSPYQGAQAAKLVVTKDPTLASALSFPNDTINGIAQQTYKGVISDPADVVLNFGYKFTKTGNDTAYVQVTIIDTMLLGDSDDKVLYFGGLEIGATVSSWTAYTMTMTPTGQTGTANRLFFEATTSVRGYFSNEVPSAGTTLWLDGISIGSAGIKEDVASASVYPNPANNVLNINSTEDVASVRVLTTDGKVVATSVSSTSINVADLNAGMYLYEVTTVSGKVARGNFAKN